ncbi:MAG TPA: vWA domain-containing protein [Polyangiaceae bacterium]|nr:vWA domain-containing protein [Polyangiaceae bacterium]
MKRTSGALVALACAVQLAMGCGDDDADGGGPFGSGAAGGFLGTGAGGPGSGGSNNGGGAATGSTACQPSPDEEGCVGQQFAGEAIPTDVYIMFDQSCSMSCPVERSGRGQCCMGGPDPRIDPVRAAVDSFLRDEDSNGMGVGIGYFGYMEVGSTSCDPDDYSEPDVPIAPLPGNAGALTSSLNSVEPTGETPTGSAIRGACDYTTQFKSNNPGRNVVILLVTDGVPETPSTGNQNGCGSTSLDDAEDAARECLTQASTPTYVLGVGQALDNLNDIADAGGTGQARIVTGGDVEGAVLEALRQIRQDATIPCQLALPPAPSGQTLDTTRVNVGICDPSGANRTTFRVPNEGECGSDGGWYYEDNETRIVLCEASCDTVSQAGSQLYFSVGCATDEPPVE